MYNKFKDIQHQKGVPNPSEQRQKRKGMSTHWINIRLATSAATIPHPSPEPETERRGGFFLFYISEIGSHSFFYISEIGSYINHGGKP
jgi:hypothetical protein